MYEFPQRTLLFSRKSLFFYAASIPRQRDLWAAPYAKFFKPQVGLLWGFLPSTSQLPLMNKWKEGEHLCCVGAHIGKGFRRPRSRLNDRIVFYLDNSCFALIHSNNMTWTLTQCTFLSICPALQSPNKTKQNYFAKFCNQNNVALLSRNSHLSFLFVAHAPS